MCAGCQTDFQDYGTGLPDIVSSMHRPLRAPYAVEAFCSVHTEFLNEVLFAEQYMTTFLTPFSVTPSIEHAQKRWENERFEAAPDATPDRRVFRDKYSDIHMITPVKRFSQTEIPRRRISILKQLQNDPETNRVTLPDIRRYDQKAAVSWRLMHQQIIFGSLSGV